MFHGNWVDLVILIIMLLYAWQGFEQGVFVLLAEMLAWLSGWVLASLVVEKAAMALVVYFGLPKGVAEVLAFMVIVGLTAQVLLHFLMRLIVRIPRQFFPSWWQGLLGVVPALINGLLVVGFITLLILKVPLFSIVHADIRASWFFARILQYVQQWLIHW